MRDRYSVRQCRCCKGCHNNPDGVILTDNKMGITYHIDLRKENLNIGAIPSQESRMALEKQRVIEQGGNPDDIDKH